MAKILGLTGGHWQRGGLHDEPYHAAENRATLSTATYVDNALVTDRCYTSEIAKVGNGQEEAQARCKTRNVGAPSRNSAQDRAESNETASASAFEDPDKAGIKAPRC